MSTGGDGPDGEASLASKDLPDSLSLSLQRLPLLGSKPVERFNGYVDAAAGATLMPDAGDHPINEQDRT